MAMTLLISEFAWIMMSYHRWLLREFRSAETNKRLEAEAFDEHLQSLQDKLCPKMQSDLRLLRQAQWEKVDEEDVSTQDEDNEETTGEKRTRRASSEAAEPTSGKRLRGEDTATGSIPPDSIGNMPASVSAVGHAAPLQLQSELARIQQEINGLRAENEKLRAQVVAGQREHNRAQSEEAGSALGAAGGDIELGGVAGSMRSELQDLRGKKSVIYGDISTFHIFNSTPRAQYANVPPNPQASAQASIDQAERELAEMRKTKDTLKHEHDERDTEVWQRVIKLGATRDEGTQREAALRAEVASLQETVAALQSKVISLNKTIALIRTEAGEEEARQLAEFASLQEENAKLRNEQAGLTKKMSLLVSRNTVLQSEIFSLRSSSQTTAFGSA
ncbi:uncharacterized protein PHACADRAFT_199657 [Phanerochaete carnosa HHB-10118-sp]|uniref:Autophagy-related protein 16 domain-containing protein n=1 Tax=Phanerochaete carnosa (strain HHB-10118-sp) TaxID=650164 RepID=K5UQQ9_PHACS|nr:uncharacterized protein PHACADRAFT_199657 [Phanerochaete carnosa HHB-10118-sp]EKM52171.1 hypothetical protein PHACADRAFT_199657 [Phanerochaete carnosa HHB-10118-sp]